MGGLELVREIAQGGLVQVVGYGSPVYPPDLT